MMKRNFTAMIAVALLAVASATANAAIVVTSSSTLGADGANGASAVDLVNAGEATLDSVTTTGFTAAGASFGIDRINNGINEAVGTVAGTFMGEGTGLTWSVDFVLNTTLNTAGYDISQIDSYVAWEGGRTGQEATFSYSTVASPGTFIALAGPELNDPNGAVNGSTLISLTDTTGTIATGVKTIRVAFEGANLLLGQNGVHQEIDVFGSATVIPEPTTLSLMGLGGILAFCRRKRR